MPYVNNGMIQKVFQNKTKAGKLFKKFTVNSTNYTDWNNGDIAEGEVVTFQFEPKPYGNGVTNTVIG